MIYIYITYIFMNIYYLKYLKYKKKYIKLKNQRGGVSIDPREVMTKNSELVRTINYSISDNGEIITLDTEIILNNGKIIKGLCNITIFPAGDLYMTDLYVNNVKHSDKTLTNCGIGTWMLNIIIKYYISKFRKYPILSLISSPEAITYYKNLGFTENTRPPKVEFYIDVGSLDMRLNQIMLKRKQAQAAAAAAAAAAQAAQAAAAAAAAAAAQAAAAQVAAQVAAVQAEEIIIEPQTFTLDQEKEKCRQYTTGEECVSNGCWYDKGNCKPTYSSVVKLGK